MAELHLQDVLIDFDGHRSYLSTDAFWVYNVADGISSAETLPTSVLKTNNSDLGHPSIDKLLNYIDIDYEGTVTVKVIYDGTTIHTFAPIDSDSRTTEWLYLPLDKRVVFQKITVDIESTDVGAKVYGIELDFDVIRRRKSE